jgi:hypothetical protein
MPLSDVVQVNISVLRALVAAAGFGKPLILGSSAALSPDRYADFSSSTGLDDMLDAGFLTSDAEYQQAQDLLAGEIVPDEFSVGRRLTPVAQSRVLTLPADPTDSVTYSITINGTVVTTAALDASSTTAELQAALVTAINGSSVATEVTAANSGADVIVTADDPGTPFTIELGTQPAAPMILGAAVANHGVQEDLTEIRDAGAVWYDTVQTSHDSGDIALIAEWTESNDTPPTIFMGQSSEADSADNVVDTAETDIANVLATAGYKRSAYWWHEQDDEYLDAGISGRELPVDPGKDNWALKEVIGMTPSSLTQTQKNNLQDKNANYYYALTNQNNITYPGKMASGDWIDVVRFVDFLNARIGEAVANLMLGSERVNFDEGGLMKIKNAINGVLQAAKDDGKLIGFTITVPALSSYSQQSRTDRVLDPPITFAAQGSGAINFVRIAGTVAE